MMLIPYIVLFIKWTQSDCIIEIIKLKVQDIHETNLQEHLIVILDMTIKIASESKQDHLVSNYIS